jgi:hypothetical protein
VAFIGMGTCATLWFLASAHGKSSALVGVLCGLGMWSNGWFMAFCHIQMPIGREFGRIWMTPLCVISSPIFTLSRGAEPQEFCVRDTKLSLAKVGSVREGRIEAKLAFCLVQVWSSNAIF